MARQKSLPNKKSTEELLKDLNNDESESSEKIIDEEDTIITFLRFYNLEAGTKKISPEYLYKLYKQFTKNPLTPLKFTCKIKPYIPMIKGYAHNDFYLINQKVLNLSERAQEFLKKQIAKPQNRLVNWKFHFENFLKKYNIKPGGDRNYIWISTPVLYNLYDKWAYGLKRKRTITIKEFRKLCKIHFTVKEDGVSMYYKIDDSITKEARNSLKNEKEKKSKG